MPLPSNGMGCGSKLRLESTREMSLLRRSRLLGQAVLTLWTGFCEQIEARGSKPLMAGIAVISFVPVLRDLE